MKLPFLILILILLAGGFYLAKQKQSPQPISPYPSEIITPSSLPNSSMSTSELEVYCQGRGGTFLYELNERNKYMECENIDEQSCTNAAGVFNQCASSCRHLPQVEVCNEMCVPVCSF